MAHHKNINFVLYYFGIQETTNLAIKTKAYRNIFDYINVERKTLRNVQFPFFAHHIAQGNVCRIFHTNKIKQQIPLYYLLSGVYTYSCTNTVLYTQNA